MPIRGIEHRILNGLAWAVGARFVAIAAGVLLNALLARLLSPSELGTYFLTMSVVALLSTLVTFGTPQVAVRIIASGESVNSGTKIKSALNKICLTVFLGALFIFVILSIGLLDSIFASLLNSNAIATYAPLVGLLVVSTAILSLFVEIYRGFHDTRMASIFGGLFSTITAVFLLAILLVISAKGLGTVFITVFMSYLAASVVAGYMLLPYFKRLHGNETYAFKELYISAWPIAVFNLILVISAQGAIWVVSYLLTETDVAIYGSAIRIVEMMSLTHTLLIAASQSTIAELFAINDNRRLEALARLMATSTTLIGLLMLLILAFWGRAILIFVFGGFYGDGYYILMILASFYVATMYFGPAGILLIMTGSVKSFLWIMLFTTMLRFILGLYLVSSFGTVGAAVAWGAGGLLQGALGWVLVKSEVRIYSHAKHGLEIYELLKKMYEHIKKKSD